MKILVIVFILMFDSLLCGKQSNEGISIYLYDKGQRSEIQLSSSDKTELLSVVNTLFPGIDDILRLHIDPSRVESIMKDHKALEIVFENETETATKNKGSFKLTKLMIPLSGDLSPDLSENRLIFLTGNPDYEGSPLVSNCDQIILRKFLEIIDN